MPKFNTILLTGVNGQVGHALASRLPALGHVIPLDRSQLDLSNVDAIRKLVQATKPDLIINPAAYTAVDKAESEPELAHAINAQAPGMLAEAAAEVGALLVHYSTDYVFDGSKTSPYLETDATNPLGVYGASKLAGEQAIQASTAPHLILRTSWVYGSYGKNFLRTILKLAMERESLSIVADQFGAPTSSASIADATISVLQNWDSSKSGIYHLSNQGVTSWHGFAQEIVRQYKAIHTSTSYPTLKISPEAIKAITTAEYLTPAKRPANSRMNGEKLRKAFDVVLPDWQLALAAVIRTLDHSK